MFTTQYSQCMELQLTTNRATILQSFSGVLLSGVAELSIASARTMCSKKRRNNAEKRADSENEDLITEILNPNDLLL